MGPHGRSADLGIRKKYIRNPFSPPGLERIDRRLGLHRRDGMSDLLSPQDSTALQSNGNPVRDRECGLYIHVPFCNGKCPYCDFYSIRASEERMDEYTNCIIECLNSNPEQISSADTLYFGGGTPSLLGAERLSHIAEAAQKKYGLEKAEITAEVNPEGVDADFFRGIRAVGINRLSFGLQSADDGELRRLGRKHSAAQAAKAVENAQKAGFLNITLDLMLAIEGQTEQSLRRSVAFCADLGVRHVSAYLLKLEPGTAYYKNRAELTLPDEDAAANLYLLACDELERRGLRQYEISNFALPGYESRHNLKYWRGEEYWGLGPAAHSFLHGKRFHYSRSIGAFLRGEGPEQDGNGGSFEEFAMLKMRLVEGLTDEACLARFGQPIPERIRRAARRYEAPGLTVCTPEGFHFTSKGFLVSDALTAEILFAPA
jgi:oxygen-independent coproporphyrinogen-3 oxidase